MSAYRLIAEPEVDQDVEPAFAWYESERTGLGQEFLDALRSAYDRIAQGPFGYQDLQAGVRHALLRRFPYAVYFAIDGDTVIVLAVLHASRDPAEWQRRAVDRRR